MNFSSMKYLLKEGFKNVFDNKKMASTSLIVICATMLIFGFFLIISTNVDGIIKSVESEQGVQAYLEDVSEYREEEIGKEIKKISGVATVKFISKEDAMELMKEDLKDKGNLLEGMKKNPFPASYFITFSNLEQRQQIQAKIADIEGVDSVENKDDTVKVIINIGKGIRIVTMAILVILVVISTMIISYTVKMAVHARGKEISIMKYVGATDGFIRTPFIIEGIVIGILAGIISMAIVSITYNIIVQKLIGFVGLMNFLTPIQFSDMMSILVIVYAALGIGIGTFGSILSMRKYLKV